MRNFLFLLPMSITGTTPTLVVIMVQNGSHYAVCVCAYVCLTLFAHIVDYFPIMHGVTMSQDLLHMLSGPLCCRGTPRCCRNTAATRNDRPLLSRSSGIESAPPLLSIHPALYFLVELKRVTSDHRAHGALLFRQQGCVSPLWRALTPETAGRAGGGPAAAAGGSFSLVSCSCCCASTASGRR